MPRYEFTTGQVLTADQMNDLSDQTVMTFAGTAARGSAIPTPVEGMVTYLEDSDELEVYTTSWGSIGGGKILQVVSTTKTDDFSASIAVGAETDITGLSATVTPRSTSSKVLVNLDITMGRTNADQAQYFTIFRGATAIASGNTAGSRQTVTGGGAGTEGAGLQSVSMNFLDTPSTTSSTTYSVKISHRGTVTSTVYVNRSQTDTDSNSFARGVSTITLMEVAG